MFMLLAKVFDLYVKMYCKFKNYRYGYGHNSPYTRHQHTGKSLGPIRRRIYLYCFVKSDLHCSVLIMKYNYVTIAKRIKAERFVG